MINSDGRPDLAAGESGEWVLDLQHRLQTLGLYLGALDGELGERTATAVHEFALVYHVTPDHDLDPTILVGDHIWTAVVGHTEHIWAAAAGAGEVQPEQSGAQSGQQSGEQDWVWHEGTWHPAGSVPQTHTDAEHVTPDGHWRWVDGQWQPNT